MQIGFNSKAPQWHPFELEFDLKVNQVFSCINATKLIQVVVEKVKNT